MFYKFHRLTICLLIGCMCYSTLGYAAGSAFARNSSSAVLFLDDQHIASCDGLERIIHPAEKHPSPILHPQMPWEGDRLYVMGTVHYDPQQKQFRIWHMAREMVGNRASDHVLYAVSDDGLNWTRPDLGLVEHGGNKQNNILPMHVHSPSVVVSPNDEQGYDYHMMAMRYALRGYVAMSSQDGLNWTEPKRVIPGGDNVTMTRDPQTQQFMAFHRQSPVVGNHKRRSIYLSVSDDFESWSEPKPVLVPDERDDAAWVYDAERQRTEFYNMTAAPYRGQYIGFVTVCRFEPTTPRPWSANQSGTDGPIYVELVHSADGRDWQRMEERPAIIKPGPASWDAGMILGLSNPIIHGDEVWVYYSGFNVKHGGPWPPKRSVIGLAKWRLDGFVSMRAAGDETGVMETTLVETDATGLTVNAIADEGKIEAELLDQGGRVIPGYSRQACVGVQADDVRATLRWRDRDALPRDRPFRIRFYLEQAELFSYRFVTR